MINGWYRDMNVIAEFFDRKREAAVTDTIRVRQVAPGVWEPDAKGEYEIFAPMLPMLAGPDSSQRAARIAAGITESLAAQARRDVIGVRVRLTQEAYTAYLNEEEAYTAYLNEEDGPEEYVVIERNGAAGGSAKCGCPDCLVLPAGVAGPSLSGGYDWEAALSGGYVSREEMRAAFAAAQAHRRPVPWYAAAGGTGSPVQAVVDERPAATEKTLAPAEPADPAEEIRLSLLEPVHMDQAELDRLVPYDKAPAGLCLNCHLGAVLPGKTLCYYCNLSGELAAQAKAKATARAAGTLVAGVQGARSRTPGTRPGPAPWSCRCKCPSRKAHEIRLGVRPNAARLVAVGAALLMMYLASHGNPFLFPVAVAFILLARAYGRKGPR